MLIASSVFMHDFNKDWIVIQIRSLEIGQELQDGDQEDWTYKGQYYSVP